MIQLTKHYRQGVYFVAATVFLAFQRFYHILRIILFSKKVLLIMLVLAQTTLKNQATLQKSAVLVVFTN